MSMKESTHQNPPKALSAERKLLVEENVAFARALAVKWHRQKSFSCMELDDVVSAAFLGLCDAALKYKETENTTFRSYCFHRISGTIRDLQRRYLKRNSIVTRLPLSEQDYQRPHREEEEPALRRACECSQVEVTVSKKKEEPESQGPFRTVTVWPRTHYGAVLPADLITPESSFARKEKLLILATLVAGLKRKEQGILLGYYFKGLPLSELCADYSLSYVSRIHTQAIARLKFRARHRREELCL